MACKKGETCLFTVLQALFNSIELSSLRAVVPFECQYTYDLPIVKFLKIRFLIVFNHISQ
jgi:hypothetical protein